MNYTNLKEFLNDKVAVSVILLGLVVRSVAAGLVPPGFDEAYYGVFTFFPAWGYFDHPPMVTLTAGLFPWLTGCYHIFFLRLGAIILFLFSSYSLYRIIAILFDAGAARTGLILFHLTPFFLVGMGAFVIPDNALGVFWLLFIYALLQIKITGNSQWFWLAGISAGFSLLAKYHGVLLIAGLGWLLLFEPFWRKYWKDRNLYLGLLLTLLIFSPNIYWNYKNEWISYLYQFGKGAGGLKLSASLFFQGISIQAAYLLPWHWLILLIGTWKISKTKNSGISFLLPFILIPVIAFTLIGATRKILPHWPMPGYIGAIILASAWIATWKKKNKTRYFITTAILTFFLIVFITVQAKTGFIPMKKKADVTLDGFGWNQLVQHLETSEILEPTDFIVARKWFTAGEMALAAETKYPVLVFNKTAPHMFAFWYDQKELISKNAICVSTDRYKFDPIMPYRQYFEKIEPLPEYVAYRNGKPAKTFYLWKCTKFLKIYETEYGR